MATRKKGLGRGLDALLGSASIPQQEVSTDAAQAAPAVPKETLDGELKHLPIEFLTPGRYQPRRDMDPQALRVLGGELVDNVLMLVELTGFEIGGDHAARLNMSAANHIMS